MTLSTRLDFIDFTGNEGFLNSVLGAPVHRKPLTGVWVSTILGKNNEIHLIHCPPSTGVLNVGQGAAGSDYPVKIEQPFFSPTLDT